MGIEEKNGNEKFIDPKLEQQALREMRESGKPLPYDGSPEENLLAAIQGARRALDPTFEIRPSNLSIEEQLKIRRQTVFTFFVSMMGVNENTTDLIIEAIEEALKPRPKTIH